jgi:hypothetical protein
MGLAPCQDLALHFCKALHHPEPGIAAGLIFLLLGRVYLAGQGEHSNARFARPVQCFLVPHAVGY